MRMLAASLAALTAATLAAESPADRFRLNQMQVLGSHNSYKQPIDPSLFQLLRKKEPKRYTGLEYSHAPLAEQLDLGLRKLEIDVVHDPRGGLYRPNPDFGTGYQVKLPGGAAGRWNPLLPPPLKELPPLE